MSLDPGDQTRYSSNFKKYWLGMVSHIFNPGTQEVEAGRWILVYIVTSGTAKTTERP